MEELSQRFEETRSGWVRLGDAEAPPPAAFLGFAFSADEEPGQEWCGLANSELVVPELLYRRSGDRAWLKDRKGLP